MKILVERSFVGTVLLSTELRPMMFSMRLRISELIHSTEESNHGWELPVVVEEEALLRWARGRHGHLVELLGI